MLEPLNTWQTVIPIRRMRLRKQKKLTMLVYANIGESRQVAMYHRQQATSRTALCSFFISESNPHRLPILRVDYSHHVASACKAQCTLYFFSFCKVFRRSVSSNEKNVSQNKKYSGCQIFHFCLPFIATVVTMKLLMTFCTKNTKDCGINCFGSQGDFF